MRNITMYNVTVTALLILCWIQPKAQVAGTPVISLKENRNVLGGTFNDAALSAAYTADGGYAVAGLSNSNDGDVSGNHGSSDLWVIKLSSTGALQWQKSLGGSGPESAQSIIRTTDEGYAVAGYTRSNDGDVSGNNGKADFWVVKLSSTGTLQWQKALGGTEDEIAYSIVQTTDGGYAVAGYSNSNNGDVSGNHGGYDWWVVKLSSTGTLQWQKTLGGTGTESAQSIIQTTDGGYAITGYSDSNDGNVSGNHGQQDIVVMKLDSSGNLQWQKAVGGTNTDLGNSIVQSADGGYAIGGYTRSNDGDVTGNHGDYDFLVIKLSNTGALEWQKTLGGTGYEKLLSLNKSTDGGFVTAGESSSNDGDVSGNYGGTDMWIVKVSNTGNLVWQKTAGGTGYDSANIVLPIENGYVTAGISNSNNGDISGPLQGGNDAFIIKLDTNGKVNYFFDDTMQQ